MLQKNLYHNTLDENDDKMEIKFENNDYENNYELEIEENALEKIVQL